MKKVAITLIALFLVIFASASGPKKKMVRNARTSYQTASIEIEKALNKKLFFANEKVAELSGKATATYVTDSAGNAYLMEVESDNTNLEKFIRKQTFILHAPGMQTISGQRFEYNVVFAPQERVK